MKENKENELKGDRFNEGKPKWGLVHWKSVEEMVKVLMHGAEKYSAENWKKGLDKREIMESAMRHLTSMMDGDEYDEESKLPHSAHVMCNMMFYIYHNIIDTKNGNLE